MKIRYCILLFLLCLLCVPALAQPGIMPVEEVEIGMRGYGRTVFLGTTVESFPVEVLAIIPQNYGHNLILIKAGGPQIDKIGGIASGMSGSPIYIKDRLAGAIAGAWSYSDHRLALVTPIEEMLALWPYEKKPPIIIEHTHKDWADLKLMPVQTPLLSYGLRGRALAMLTETLLPYNMHILNGASSFGAGYAGNMAETTDTIEPGSALAVDLMRGDMGLSFFGTVTHVGPCGILAFGHPLFNMGPVDFFMSRAYIHGIVPSNELPFKLASSLNTIGKISQDRGAGVAGVIGQYPALIPVRIEIKDAERGLKKTASLQITKFDPFIIDLVGVSVLQLVDETLDRVGSGSAEVRLEIAADGLPGMKLITENSFYSPRDISSACLDEILYILYLLRDNPFREINIFNISVKIEANNKNSLAYIQDVKLSTDVVEPGQDITATVYLRPYRSEVIKQEVTISIPKNMPPGGATLMISGGPSYYRPSYEEELEYDPIETLHHDDFDSFIEDILQQAKNNQLSVELYPYYYGGEDDEDRPCQNTFELKNFVDTDYILEGFWSAELEIKEDPAKVSEN